MGVFDILSGKLPFWKCKGGDGMESIEQDFVALLNMPTHVIRTIENAVTEKQSPYAAGRYTLNPGVRTKILDTGERVMSIYITVPGVGAVAYASHDPIRVLSSSGGLHEGIPLTNNPAVAGRVTPNLLYWKGELYLTGDTPNMIVDVEAS